ncbi:MAG: TonB-dependent receptor [Sphingomonas sp.]
MTLKRKTGPRARALCGSALAAMTLLSALPAYAQATDEPRQSAGEQADDGAEIVVTGTSIRGVPPTGSNLIAVSREDVEVIGAVTTAELLATVPQLNSFNTAPRTTNGGVGSFAPGLRGLASSATLPLMNGHRLVSGSTQQTSPDYPFLPELAVERVEIVADGASAIYGSDAVAGVVNFITRKRYSGIEASVRYGMADNYDSFSAGGIVGKDWGSGSALVSYQYSRNGNVTGADRDYRSLDFRGVGGVDTRGTICPAANVNLGGATYYAAPSLTPGLNYCDLNGSVDLVPASRLHSAFATAHQDLTDTITLWGEALYSDRKDTVQAVVPGQTVVLTAANPFFRQPPGTATGFEIVYFRPDALVGDDHFSQTYGVKALNASAGIDVALPHALKLSVYGTFDAAENHTFQPAINPIALAAAAAGTTAATALDPFGSSTSAAVASAITNYSNDVTIKQRTKLAAVKIDGPMARLPGGEVKVAAGAEYRRETFEQSGFVGTSPVPENLGRDIKSVYGELYVPIFGDGNAAPLMRRLAVSVSGRYDDYSDFGSTTNPKFGVNWDPVDGLTLRGTYGRSFRAPGLRDVGATVGSYYFDAATAAIVARDPTRGSAQVNTVALYGGNKSMQPEKARTYSFGADLRPLFLPGFSASATFYDIKYTNVISTPAGSIIFTDPTFASIVYRNPTPAQLASLLGIAVPVTLPTPLPAIGNLLDLRQGNFGVRKTNGIDFDVNYRRKTGFGAVFGGIAGNYILNYKSQLSPTAPTSNSLQLGIPRTTLRTTLGLTAGPISVVNFVNRRSGVTSTFATPAGTGVYSAKGYTTVDLRVTVKLPETGLARGTELALQINDLLDATPPFFPATDGIGGNYNPIGRFVALNLRKVF